MLFYAQQCVKYVTRIYPFHLHKAGIINWPIFLDENREATQVSSMHEVGPLLNGWAVIWLKAHRIPKLTPSSTMLFCFSVFSLSSISKDTCKIDIFLVYLMERYIWATFNHQFSMWQFMWRLWDHLTNISHK